MASDPEVTLWKGCLQDTSCTFIGSIKNAEAFEVYLTTAPHKMEIDQMAGWIQRDGGISATASCKVEGQEFVDHIKIKMEKEQIIPLLEDFRARSAGNVPYVIYDLSETKLYQHEKMWNDVIGEQPIKNAYCKSLLVAFCEDFDVAAEALGEHVQSEIGKKADRCGIITGICLVPTLFLVCICARNYQIEYGFNKSPWPGSIPVKTDFYDSIAKTD